MTGCPLCGATTGPAREEIAYEKIWDRLREEWGARFSAPVLARHTPAPTTTVRECDTCGLQWFDPAVAGDSVFYEELMSQVSYEDDRWEFGAVAGELGPQDAVVDFGCGEGRFLRAIAPRVARPVGVDHNRPAIEALNRHGIEGHATSFEAFADANAGTFDVACTFHLLEHLDNVPGTVAAMMRCLKPGGRLYVAVPNRDRLRGDALEPLDCPPHHVSRWSAGQVPELARRVGAEVLRVRLEPAAFHLVQQQLMVPVDRRLASVPAPFRRGLRALALRARVGPRRYERGVVDGAWERRGWTGLTLLAVLRAPG